MRNQTRPSRKAALPSGEYSVFETTIITPMQQRAVAISMWPLNFLAVACVVTMGVPAAEMSARLAIGHPHFGQLGASDDILVWHSGQAIRLMARFRGQIFRCYGFSSGPAILRWLYPGPCAPGAGLLAGALSGVLLSLVEFVFDVANCAERFLLLVVAQALQDGEDLADGAGQVICSRLLDA